MSKSTSAFYSSDILMGAEERIQEAIAKNQNYLELNNLELTSIPKSLEKLTNLTELTLFGNKLTEIPPEVFKLEQLEILDICCNLLRQVPAEISRLTNLERLSLKGNLLKTLPVEIGELRNMTELDLTDCEISQLPGEVGALVNLSSLYLGENKLRDISWIGNLEKLEHLDLAENLFTNYPPEIAGLKNIIKLEMDKMPGDLPEELAHLTDKIEYNESLNLAIENNPILENTGLPGTELEFFLRDFKTYLQRMRANRKVCISHLYILPPNPDANRYLEEVEKNGTRIDSEIKSFYKQCNGIRFRWFLKLHPDLDYEIDPGRNCNFSTDCFRINLADYESSHIYNYIAIETVEDLFSEQAFMRETLSEYKQRENVDLYIFDNSAAFAGQLCFGISTETRELELYGGDDYFACINKRDYKFSDYIKGLAIYDEDAITSY